MATTPPTGTGDVSPSSEPSTPSIGASAMAPEVDSAASGLGSGTETSSASTGGPDGGTTAKVTEQLKAQAQQVRSQATDKVRSAAEQGKEKAVGTLEGLSQAAHRIADELNQGQTAAVAPYAHKAADLIGGFSQSLRDKPVDELLDDVRVYVRQNPSVAIGVAVATGFALARFLKATQHDETQAKGSAYAGYSGRGDATGTTASTYTGGEMTVGDQPYRSSTAI